MSLGVLSFEIDADDSGAVDAMEELDERLSSIEEQLGATGDAAGDAGEELEKIGKKANAAFALQGVKMFAKAIKELGGFIYDSAKSAADAGNGPMKDFVENIEAVEDSFKKVGAQAAAQLAPILKMLSKQFLDSKDAASALKDVGNFLANVFKVLGSVGAVIVGVFETVGQTIGAVASAIVNFVSGDFKGAMESLKLGWEEGVKSVQKYASVVDTIVSTKGNDFSGPIRAPKGDSAETRELKRLKDLADAADIAARSVAKLSDETDDAWSAMDDWASFIPEYKEQFSQVPLIAAEGAFDLMMSMKETAGVVSTFAQSVLQAVPRLNQLVQAAQQGAQMGGVWGALIAVIVQLMSETEGFGKIIEFINGILDGFIGVLGPLVDGLAKLFESSGPAFDALFSTLAGPLEMIGGILGAIAPLLSTLAEPLGTVAGLVKSLGGFLKMLEIPIKLLVPILQILLLPLTLFGRLIENLMATFSPLIDKFMKGISDISKALDDFGRFVGTLGERIENLIKGHGFVSNAERAHAATPLSGTSQMGGPMPPPGKAIDALDDFTKAVATATEALTNVPSGYKVAYARFQATAAAAVMGHKSDSTDFAGLADARGAITLNIETLTLTTDSPQDFFQKLRREAFKKTGAAF